MATPERPLTDTEIERAQAGKNPDSLWDQLGNRQPALARALLVFANRARTEHEDPGDSALRAASLVLDALEEPGRFAAFTEEFGAEPLTEVTQQTQAQTARAAAHVAAAFAAGFMIPRRPSPEDGAF